MRADHRALLRELANAYHDPARVVLEGFHPARHAVRFGATLRTAVTYDAGKLLAMAERLAPDVVPAVAAGLVEVDRSLFDKLCPRSLTSPLLSVTDRPPDRTADAVADRRRPVVCLESPRNPGNVGAVIRVAAAADVGAVLVTGQVDPWSPVVIRAAAGLQFAVPVGTATLPLPGHRPVVVLDADGDPLRSADLDPAAVLVIGGERYGLSPAVRRMAQRSVAIPMRPGVSSLNLATAVSAVLFAWRTAAEERTGAPPW
ncbi:MAG TPA: TrmH family RNA methyltransferase [Acidimicrobiales bacterium]|nr:TrmH family RNA methyltransferase [Acidimicrobiales bacterium]